VIADKLIAGPSKGGRLFRIEYDQREHMSFEPIRAAAKAQGWKFITVPHPQMFVFDRNVNRRWLRPLLHLVTHLKLAVTLMRAPKAVNIFVREFITIPLLITAPLWWHRRKRIVFLNNHNIQFAYKKLSHRIALTLLLRGGIRIAALELPYYSLIGLRGLREDIVIPFPITLRPWKKHNPERRQLRVGVLTSFRREQRAEELIEYLSRVCSDESRNWELAVASRFLGHLNSLVTKISVSLPLKSDEDYWNAISSFDVIVLSYDRTEYEYRTSGVVTDAIACAVPVICPDYPIMARQVNWPAKMGLVYRNLEEVPALIAEIAKWPAAGLSAASKEHQRRRGAQVYGEILDSLSSGNSRTHGR
jgi:glycosyltransferase involved in cell wall biosynthesis